MTAEVLLYRPSLALKSGATSLMLWQAAALEAAGANVHLGGTRGRIKLWLRTGRYARRVGEQDALQLARSGRNIFVDHAMAVPDAALVYVHNLAAGLAAYLPGPVEALDREAAYFASLAADVPIVANSALVARDLTRIYGVGDQRVSVLHPGINTGRFGPGVRQRLRGRERSRLGCGPDTPLIGLVTSGHFEKRGLAMFLDVAEHIRQSRADARFLVVGSHRLPESAASHPLFRGGHAHYRPKDTAPERHYAPLDILLHPALYEEFGMVVAEAAAMGIPVVVSGRVGAAEVLSAAQPPLPDYTADAFAARCLEILDDAGLAARLSAAGAERGLSASEYGRAAAATILAQKRRLR